VLVGGFYDGVSIPDDVREILAAVPDDETAILERNGVAQAERVAPSLQEALQYPSLNIRGLSSAWTGREARTIIPATALAELDIRLVAESDPDHLFDSVRRHVEGLGYVVLDRAPTDAERLEHAQLMTLTRDFSYAAFRSDFDAPPGRLARAALER